MHRIWLAPSYGAVSVLDLEQYRFWSFDPNLVSLTWFKRYRCFSLYDVNAAQLLAPSDWMIQHISMCSMIKSMSYACGI